MTGTCFDDIISTLEEEISNSFTAFLPSLLIGLIFRAAILDDRLSTQKPRCDRFGSLLLHSREHVRVDCQSKGRGAVTQAFLNDFRMNTRPEQLGGVSVS